MTPNYVPESFLQSESNTLFDDIFIIFFACMILTIIVFEVCISNLKYRKTLINIR